MATLSPDFLAPDEQQELARCEAIIARGLMTFYEVGAALVTIRDLGLYRATHPTFEAYCNERWKLCRGYAYNQIEAAGVYETLQAAGFEVLPQNERQARPLAKLDPAARVQVWNTVLQTRGQGGLTAQHVTSVVRTLQAANAAPNPTPESPEATEVASAAEPAEEEGGFVAPRTVLLCPADYAVLMELARAEGTSCYVALCRLISNARPKGGR